MTWSSLVEQTFRRWRRWERDSDVYGPGCIDLKLEQVASTAGAKVELLALFDTVSERVAQYGEKVPGVILQALCRTPGVRFGADLPAASPLAAIDRLRRLSS